MAQFGGGEGGGVALLRDAVEDGAYETVVGCRRGGLGFGYRVARAADDAPEARGRQRMAAVEVYAAATARGELMKVVERQAVALLRVYRLDEGVDGLG